MRCELLLLTAVACLTVSCGRAPDSWVVSASQTPLEDRPAVLVELFTSEGCSSCPPADIVLRELTSQQPIPSATVIGLGEHVDYWDRLGWRDPFSSAGFSARQSEYDMRALHTGSIYTPQLVVDGRFQVVGSDRAAVAHAIEEAARSPKATVRLAGSIPEGGREMRVDIQLEMRPDLSRQETADVVVAIAEDELKSQVTAGENHGRALEHARVTRTLTVVGKLAPGERMFSATAMIPLGDSWRRSHLHAVAFVQERQSRRIVGTAMNVNSPRRTPSLPRTSEPEGSADTTPGS